MSCCGKTELWGFIDMQNYDKYLPAVVSSDSVQASIRSIPFVGESLKMSLPEGLTIVQAVYRAGLHGILTVKSPIYFFVNDSLIKREDWGKLVLKRGDVVSINIVPSSSGGGGGTKTLRTVAMLAIVAASIATGQLYGAALAAELGGTAAAWTAGLTVATSTAGMLALNALVPPPVARMDKENDSPTYSITGMRNIIDPYGPVPRLYGKHRLYPRYGALPYTEIGQNAGDQYFRCLFCIDKGEYQISDLKIGDTNLSDFLGVDWRVYYTGAGGTPDLNYDLYPNSPYEESLAISLLYDSYPNNWQTRTTQTDTDEIQLQINFPLGLYDQGNSKKLQGVVTLEAQYSLVGSGIWTAFGNVKQLNFASGQTNANIIVGATVTGLSSGAVGVIQYVADNGTYIVAGVDEEGHQILEWQNNFIYATVNVSSGNFISTETVRINNGGSTVDVALASLVSQGWTTYTEKVGTPFAVCMTAKVPRAQYDVRVRRCSANSDGQEHFSETYWTALRSITYSPPVKLADCTLIALRIKASGQLNGVLDQFNCVAESILNAFDGVSWNKIVTRNPAWVFTDALTGSSNKKPISIGRLDSAALYNWAARNELAQRYFDGIFDFNTTVWDALKQVCSVGRATPGFVDGFFTVVEDKTQTVPVQHFSPRNTWGFQGSRVFNDIPHAYKIRFINSDKNYAQDECIVYADKPGGGVYSEIDATLFETLDFFGVTTYNHCWKLGRYLLAVLSLRPEKYVFNTDIESLVCTRGDLVKLNYDSMLVGLGTARVKTATTSSMTFDDVFTMAAGHSYVARIRKSDGTSVYAPLVTNAGENYSVTFNPVLSQAPGVGNLILFGESGLESIDAIITRIDNGAGLTAKITAVPYAPAVLTADGGSIPDWDSNITLPPVVNRTPPKPKIISNSIGYVPVLLNDDGTYQIVMTVGFEITQQGMEVMDLLTRIEGFQAQYKDVNDLTWRDLPLIGKDGRSFSFYVDDGENYDARVRSFSTPGNYSDWETLSSVSAELQALPPPDVTGLQVKGGGTTFEGADLEVEWTPVAGGGVNGPLVDFYKVEVRTSDGGIILRTEYVTQEKYVYSFDMNVIDGGPRGSVQIRVQAKNRYSVLSQNAATQVFTNLPPGNPQGLGAKSYMGGVEFYWTTAVTLIDSTRVTRDGTTRKTRDDVDRLTYDTVESAGAIQDFSHYLYKIKLSATGTWSEWKRTIANTVVYTLSSEEKDAYGADVTIYFEVKCIDIFNQESSSTAIDKPVGSLNIIPTDVADFAISASKIFTKIAIPEALSFTDNYPSSGYITWSSFIIYYNGVAHTIPGGSTNNRFVYWKDLAGILSSMDAHPPTAFSDWKPQEDFIIAVNFGGIAQEGWLAIANGVIGSAYIMTAAINDAHISDLSGVKISATTQIAIGSRTFGALGIQLEYNNGSPRFYAGNGVLDYVKIENSQLELSTSKTNALVIQNGGGMVVQGGGDISLIGSPSNPGKLIFKDGSYVPTANLFATDYYNFSILPSANQVQRINIGYTGSLWNLIYIASTGFGIHLTHTITGGSRMIGITLDSNGIALSHDTYSIKYVVANSGTYPYFAPTTHKTTDLGWEGGAWNDVWADDFQNVADFYHLDSRDDLAELRKIKGSGVLHPQTGLEMIDDDTVPEWMLTKGGDQKTVRDPEGKPYLSNRMLLSLLMGACRQLDEKIAELKKGRGE